MKTQLLCFLTLFLFAAHISAQPDNQWLIWNSKGKDGLIAPDGPNKYQNPITGNFTLSNIAQPAPTSNPRAQNDLFVIYNNGDHYLIRDEPGHGSFYDAANLSNVNHNFTTSSPSTVAYLYLTNKYEGDDPPARVKASTTTGTATPPVYTLGTTASNPDGIIYADHHVITAKDITLIIDQRALSLPPYGAGKYSLKYQSIEPIPNITPTPPPAAVGNYFGLQPIFFYSQNINEPGFPHGSYSTNGDTIIDLNNADVVHKPFTYINLRPTAMINNYGPDPATGKARYRAIFQILDATNNVVSRHTENINGSDDPNFIRVESICKAPNNDQVVTYYLQFRNTSIEEAAHGISVHLTFPPNFLTNCFTVVEWSPAGEASARSYTHNGMQYSFTFDPQVSLSVCPSDTVYTGCTGFIRFKVGVPASVDLHDENNSLRLLQPEVIFDGISYPIFDFQDRLVYKDNEWSRPFALSKNCECGRIICRKCYAGAIAALALAVAIFLRRRRKKIIPPNP